MPYPTQSNNTYNNDIYTQKSELSSNYSCFEDDKPSFYSPIASNHVTKHVTKHASSFSIPEKQQFSSYQSESSFYAGNSECQSCNNYITICSRSGGQTTPY